MQRVDRSGLRTERIARPLQRPRAVPRFQGAHGPHELFEDGQVWDPAACAGSVMYSTAVAELGNGAFGSDKKLKPAWLLRKLMVNKWIKGDGKGMPD